MINDASLVFKYKCHNEVPTQVVTIRHELDLAFNNVKPKGWYFVLV